MWYTKTDTYTFNLDDVRIPAKYPIYADLLKLQTLYTKGNIIAGIILVPQIKTAKVFKNVSCDRIAKFAPTSLEDLKALRCLDEAQITLYGQDIIEIVSQVLNR